MHFMRMLLVFGTLTGHRSTGRQFSNPENVVRLVGNEVILDCDRDAGEIVIWSYVKPGQSDPVETPIPGRIRHRTVTTNYGHNRLIIEEARLTDAGTYVCRSASNPAAFERSAAFVVMVADPPVCRHNASAIDDLRDGETVALSCSVTYGGDTNIRVNMTWVGPDGETVSSGIYPTETSVTAHRHLAYVRVNGSRLDRYRCVVSFDAGSRFEDVSASAPVFPAGYCVLPEKLFPVRTWISESGSVVVSSSASPVESPPVGAASLTAGVAESRANLVISSLLVLVVICLCVLMLLRYRKRCKTTVTKDDDAEICNQNNQNAISDSPSSDFNALPAVLQLRPATQHFEPAASLTDSSLLTAEHSRPADGADSEKRSACGAQGDARAARAARASSPFAFSELDADARSGARPSLHREFSCESNSETIRSEILPSEINPPTQNLSPFSTTTRSTAARSSSYNQKVTFHVTSELSRQSARLSEEPDSDDEGSGSPCAVYNREVNLKLQTFQARSIVDSADSEYASTEHSVSQAPPSDDKRQSSASFVCRVSNDAPGDVTEETTRLLLPGSCESETEGGEGIG